MIEWPTNLVSDIARRRTVLVLGSGVSRHSECPEGNRPPDWEQFLWQSLEKIGHGNASHIEKAIDSGDFLHACEWLKRRYDEHWIAHLRKIFRRPKFKPSELHELILRLDSRIVFSLNFDDIYETTANQVGQNSYIVKNFHDDDVSEFLRGDDRYIVKVHGSLNTPDKMIFTQNDYASARTKYASFYRAFDASLITHSFAFIGSGFTDPDINLMLENQKFIYSSSYPHYFITSRHENGDLKNSLRNNRNLKTIEYEKIDEYHSGLIQEIKTLVQGVDDERENLRSNENW